MLLFEGMTIVLNQFVNLVSEDLDDDGSNLSPACT